MNQQKSPHALSSLFTIIGLVLLIGGAGVWMWLNQSDTQTVAGTANSTTSDVSALLPSAHPVADVDALAFVIGQQEQSRGRSPDQLEL